MPSERRRAVAELRARGYSYAEISARLGISKSTVAYHARRAGEPVNPKFARRYDWSAVQREVDAGRSRLECMRLFGFSSYAWNEAVKRGALDPPARRTPLRELLVRGRPTHRSHLRARLIEAGLKVDACEECGCAKWRGRPLSLTLHHVNGVGDDNRLENLQILCPNCHSQTPNFGSKNRGRRGA